MPIGIYKRTPEMKTGKNSNSHFKKGSHPKTEFKKGHTKGFQKGHIVLENWGFQKGNKGCKYWLGKKRSDKTRKNMSEAHKGKKQTEESNIKRSENAKQNPNYGMKRKKHTQETKNKISKNSKSGRPDVKEKYKKSMQKYWNDPEFWKKVLSTNSPNEEEKQLNQILSKILLDEYEFVGNGKLKIGRKIPDFVNKDNNKLIELYGNYYHKSQNPQDRINYFKPFGYDTLVIWTSELRNITQLKNKILNFNND